MPTSSINNQDLIPPKKEWTGPEKWAWEQICKGEIADFNILKYDKEIDPRKEEEWTNERRISPKFLETILFEDIFCRKITRKGFIFQGHGKRKIGF